MMLLTVRALVVVVVAAVAVAVSADPGLVYPNGLALDGEGNLFVSDVGAHRVFRVDRAGRLAVVAGTGEAGFAGDGGAAVDARLNAPHDLAFDAEGNLLVADTFNHRIRRIDRRGMITTVAEGFNNPQSIAVDREGNLVVADTFNHVVKRVDRAGKVSVVAGTEAGLAGDGGPAIKAQLNSPQAVAVGPDGALYVSDGANSRIRRVGTDGVIRTVAGSGPGSGEGGAGFGGDGGPVEKAKLFSPADLTFDAAGHLYVSDSGNNRVRLIAHGLIATVAGSGKPGAGGDGGKAVRAELNTPQKVAVGTDGAVYVADRVNHRVRRVDAWGVISTVAGGGAAEGIMVEPGVPSGGGKK